MSPLPGKTGNQRMERFQWCEAFKVGDGTVDDQHKRIFALLADLHQDIHGKHAQLAVRETLKQLLAYTQRHFADEEALMRSVEYPQFEEHKALHDELMDKVWGMYSRCQKGDEDLSIELLVFLNDWLTEHILEKDRAIGRYIRELG